MEPDAIVIAALGVLLTEVRVARRALEEVQRASSRYMGIEFSKAFAEGASFGAPPLYQGALRVHVININDLAPGNSIADLLMGLLGGLGNLVGGIIGGMIGSTVSALGLPVMIYFLHRAIDNIREIVRMLGVTAPERQPTQAESRPVTQAQTGETLLTTVDGLRGLVRALTALFIAGSGETSGFNQAGRTEPEVLTPAGERWMAILAGVNRLLDRMTHLVDGLILLIPILVGSIALLITSLPEIRRELLLTFQFILRNIIVLRGVVLTTLFEMMATAARLTAAIVGIIGTVLEGILGSIVTVIASILDNAFAALEVLTDALTAVVRSLLQWLVNGVFNTLREIGNLSVFRTIDHFVRMLPGLIEPIFMITVAATANASTQLPTDISGRLNRAFEANFAGGASGPAGTLPGGAVSGTGTSMTSEQIIGEFPDLNAILDPLHATLSAAVQSTGAEITGATRGAFDTVNGALTGLGGRFDAAITREADLSRRVLAGHRDTITANADALARAIATPLNTEGPSTGLEAIAEAYQTWLTSEGTMAAIFNRAAQHIARAPAPGEPSGPLDLTRGAYDRPRASIEIERVEIVLDPPEVGNPPPADLIPDRPLSDEDVWLAWHRHDLELREREIHSDDLRAVVQ